MHSLSNGIVPFRGYTFFHLLMLLLLSIRKLRYSGNIRYATRKFRKWIGFLNITLFAASVEQSTFLRRQYGFFEFALLVNMTTYISFSGIHFSGVFDLSLESIFLKLLIHLKIFLYYSRRCSSQISGCIGSWGCNSVLCGPNMHISLSDYSISWPAKLELCSLIRIRR